MAKYIIGVVVLVVLAMGGYFFFVGDTTSATPQDETTAPMTMATSTYATSTFSIVHPANYGVDDAYAYDQFGPTKLIHGVKFTIPMTMATGTNLSADSGISVETLPRAKNCTADIYILDNVKAQSWTDNGVTYSVATTSSAGAGNFYEEQVYAMPGSKPCIAVRYFVHSTSIGNYPPGTVREFDRTALLAAFDEIRRTLQLAPATPAI